MSTGYDPYSSYGDPGAIGVPYSPADYATDRTDYEREAAGVAVPALNLEELSRPVADERRHEENAGTTKRGGGGGEDGDDDPSQLKKNVVTLRRSNQQLRELNHSMKLSMAQSQGVREENEKLQIEVRRLQSQVKSLNGELGHHHKVRASLAETKKDKQRLEEKVEELEETMRTHRSEIQTIESLKGQTKSLTTRATALEQELEELKKENRELKFDKMVKVQTLEAERQKVEDRAKLTDKRVMEYEKTMQQMREEAEAKIAELETSRREVASLTTTVRQLRTENSRLEVKLDSVQKSMDIVLGKSGELRRNYEQLMADNSDLRRDHYEKGALIDDLHRRFKSAEAERESLVRAKDERDRMIRAQEALQQQVQLDAGCLKQAMEQDRPVDPVLIARCSHEAREVVQLLANLRKSMKENEQRLGRIDSLKEFIEEQNKVVDDQQKEMTVMRDQLREVQTAHKVAQEENVKMREIAGRMREELQATHSLGGQSEARIRAMADQLKVAKARVQTLEKWLDDIYATDEINKLFDHSKRGPRRPSEPGPYAAHHSKRRERIVR